MTKREQELTKWVELLRTHVLVPVKWVRVR